MCPTPRLRPDNRCWDRTATDRTPALKNLHLLGSLDHAGQEAAVRLGCPAKTRLHDVRVPRRVAGQEVRVEVYGRAVGLTKAHE